MGHFLTGIKGAKPRFGPSIAQLLAAEETGKRKLRKLRKMRKLRARAKAAGTAQSRQRKDDKAGG